MTPTRPYAGVAASGGESGAGGRPLGLLEAARLTGGWRYSELALFELLGAQAASCPHDGVATFLAAAALAHAWRAEQLAGLLPVSLGLPDVAACTASPGKAFERALALLGSDGPDAWGEGEGGDGDGGGAAAAVAAPLERLGAVLGPLYGTLDATYARRLAGCNEAAEQPLRRVLGRLLADLRTVRAEGQELLAGTSRPAGGLAERLRAVLEAEPAPLGVAVGPPIATAAVR